MATYQEHTVGEAVENGRGQIVRAFDRTEWWEVPEHDLTAIGQLRIQHYGDDGMTYRYADDGTADGEDIGDVRAVRDRLRLAGHTVIVGREVFGPVP